MTSNGQPFLVLLPVFAVQIILGTTVVALFTIPQRIRFGLSFAGLAP